jgi:hypothetical protein
MARQARPITSFGPRQQVPDVFPMDYSTGPIGDLDLTHEFTQDWMDREYESLATDIKGWEERTYHGVAANDAGNA